MMTDNPTSTLTRRSRTEVPSAAHILNLIAIPIALATVAFVIFDIESPIRVWLTVALFAFGSGSGITQFLRIPDAALQIGVVIGLSVAIDILLAQTLLSVHNMSAPAGVCVLAGLTLIRPISLPSAPTTTDNP